MLDSFRYYLAFLTVATLPWALLVWYLVHPFVGFWRRVGPFVTYTVLIVLGLLFVAATYVWRAPLLAVEFGTGPALWVAAALAYAAAVLVELQCRKHLSFRMLVGMPELAPEPGGGKLLTAGIYGRVRHPRYISITFGMIAAGLFCNYLTLWILVAATVPGLYGVTVFEERELRDRFGEAYVEYCRRVPRFLPRRS